MSEKKQDINLREVMTSYSMSANIVRTVLAPSGVLRITLNDPVRRNSLSEKMLLELDEAIEHANVNHSVRVIILGAVGSVFCAGHDLKEIAAGWKASDRGRCYFQGVLSQCSRVMQKIVACQAPIIAEIDGVATAAGCQLVASCDLALASERSQFCTNKIQH